MKLFKRKNRFGDACNNVISNKKLYNSIVKLQNDLVVYANTYPKVIAIVSPFDRVYNSLMAKSIAEVYAHNNKKTLLIDLDMHTPTMDKLFKLENEKSILDIAYKNDKNAINKVSDNLDVILARVETYQANFLVSNEFKQALMQLKDLYDHIVVILPPILDNQDILLIKEYLDVVLLVSKKDETTIKEINKAVRFIKINRINFAGTIFIN